MSMVSKRYWVDGSGTCGCVTLVGAGSTRWGSDWSRGEWQETVPPLLRRLPWPLGDGNGDNAQWIDPKPRDFVAATFKCRSTPTGTLPTERISTTPFPAGLRIPTCRIGTRLPAQNRDGFGCLHQDILAALAKRESRATQSRFPPSQPSPSKVLRTEGNCSRRWSAGNATGSRDAGDGPSAPTLTDSKDQPIRPYNFADATTTRASSAARRIRISTGSS